MSDEKLDLVVFVQSNSYGGTERHTLDFINHLNSKGLKSVFIYCGEGFDGHVPTEFSSVGVFKVNSRIQNLNTENIRAWPDIFKRFKSRKALLVKPSYFSVDLKFLLLLRFYYKDITVIEHSLPPKLPALPRLGLIPKVGYWRLRNEFLRFLFAKLVDKVIVVSNVAKSESEKHTYYKKIKVCFNREFR